MIDFLIDALKKHCAPFLARLWDSVFLWRTLGLLIVAGSIAVWTFRARLRDFLLQPNRMAHDADIFQRSDAIMSEQSLSACMTSLWNENACWLENHNKVHAFLEFFNRTENQYLSRKLSRRLRALHKALDDLTNFTGLNFFLDARPGANRLIMFPEMRESLKRGEQSEFYQGKANELAVKVKLVDTEYREYRLAIKRYLVK